MSVIGNKDVLQGLLLTALSLATTPSPPASEARPTPIPATTASARAGVPQRLADAVARFAVETKVPSLGVGVIADGAVVLSEALGSTAPADAGGRPVDRSTIYHLASLSKPLVATAVVALAEHGKLALDDPIVKHVPYFRLADERFRQITVRQLLLHTSGLPDLEDYHWDEPELDDGALERYVRSLASIRLQSAPGEKYAYSNIGYEILGDVIAKASGRTFEEFLSETVFRPLDMKSTTFLLADVPRDHLAQPCVHGEGRAFVLANHFPYNRVHAPSSTLYSNVDDMVRWLRASLGRGELDGKRVLGADAFVSMLSDGLERTLPPGAPVRSVQHLGWSTLVIDGIVVHGHGGHDKGFRSMMVFAPRAQGTPASTESTVTISA